MTKKEVITLDWDHYKKVTYSPAVKKGNLLFISGQTGINYKTGKVVGLGDVVAQARQAYENIREILEKSGASFADVVKITDYIIPEALGNYKATAEVRREHLGNDFPASTGVVVNRLVRSEFMIEIDVVAVVD
ncbi:MAG: RidA family protein [Dehalococcoidia bacterium]|nr:RidA family protein [Dehalococcoidia bacterium]